MRDVHPIVQELRAGLIALRRGDTDEREDRLLDAIRQLQAVAPALRGASARQLLRLGRRLDREQSQPMPGRRNLTVLP